jgi:hypothetical protein
MCYRRKQLIFVLGLSIGAGLWMGVLSIAFCDVPVNSALQNGMAAQQVSFKIAENEGIVANEKKEQARPLDQKKLTPTMDKPKDGSRAKTTPPKKFVPSEKIRADQAVDFPADI